MDRCSGITSLSSSKINKFAVIGRLANWSYC